MDIMSCGLGAVILIFMLVKNNIDNTVIETELLKADMERLHSEEQELRRDLTNVQGRIGTTDNAVRVASGVIASLKSSISAQHQDIEQSNKQLAALKKAIENTAIAQKADVIENEVVGEETYLMGLKVEGRKVAILLDASASMTDEVLIDVIRRKNRSDQIKRKGPKWLRTVEIVKWLLARLPKNAEVTVIAFNAKSTVLGGPGWKSGSDAKALSSIIRDLNILTPNGPTNLQQGLDTLAPLGATNVYVITDGLPTDGNSNYRSLNPFSSCSSLLSKATTISGECRVKLFRQTIAESAPKNGAVVNVVLLPIEGDPEAAPEYWNWAAVTGGLLISPAANWP
ncbi:MAG: hypothetical protein JKY27_01200 [Magnetovibrio sp.]|nr:hypothetical protein [Magnetovibrio sp.]